MSLFARETLCESGRCIDVLKKRRSVLKKRGRALKKRGKRRSVLKKRARALKRGRVLKKLCLVRGTGGRPLLQKRGGGFFRRGGGGFLRTRWRSLRSSTPSHRPYTKPIVTLAAQCEIPPHIAQYPFEIVSQRGVSHAFALFS